MLLTKAMKKYAEADKISHNQKRRFWALTNTMDIEAIFSNIKKTLQSIVKYPTFWPNMQSRSYAIRIDP